jgi:hypothetical protein
MIGFAGMIYRINKMWVFPAPPIIYLVHPA